MVANRRMLTVPQKPWAQIAWLPAFTGAFLGCLGPTSSTPDGFIVGVFEDVTSAVQTRVKPLPLRSTIDGGNMLAAHGCADGDAYYFEDPVQHAEPQLHVIGVQKPADFLAEPPGIKPIRVHVTRPGRTVLVLSAFESVLWEITSDPDAIIERVLVNGERAQIVSTPPGTPEAELYVSQQSGQRLGPFGYEWPSWMAADLVQAAEAQTGLSLTSFRGCRAAGEFVIDPPGDFKEIRSSADTVAPSIAAGCEFLGSESGYCMTISGFKAAHLYMLGLDSGNSCFVNELGLADHEVASMGWAGDYIYACYPQRGIARISVHDGSVDFAPVRCRAVTSDDDATLLAVLEFESADSVLSEFYLVRFASFEAAAQRLILEAFPVSIPYRIAVRQGRVYLTDFASIALDSAVLQPGARITRTPLEQYNFGINAIDVTADDKLILGSATGNGGIRIYNATTGVYESSVNSLFDRSDISGIKCAGSGGS